MSTMKVVLRSIPGTEAAVGLAGGHTVVVDRTKGKAGGEGLGFNGGELLGLAIGGCLCNDLRYVAHRTGVQIDAISVEVMVEFGGDPLLATSAAVSIDVASASPAAEIDALIREATATSTVSNSLRNGVPVSVERKSV